MQLYGGDGYALLASKDPVELAVAYALAAETQRLDRERDENLARMIRNEVAKMLDGK